jgi:hypothetical protein
MSKSLRLEIVLPRAAQELPRLPPVVRKLLPLCDGTRTLETVLGTGGLPADDARRAVERLLQLGVVQLRPPRGKAPRALSPATLAWLRRAGDFSDEEEAFFSSPFDHLIEET